jgi:hypothetical protein
MCREKEAMKDQNYEETEMCLPSAASRILSKKRSEVAPPILISRPQQFGRIQQKLAIPSLILNTVLVAFIMIYYTNSFLLSCAPATASNSSRSPQQTAMIKLSKHNSSAVPVGYVPYEKIIGHLHFAKTAGTEINGELAAHYERVCGHKG